MREFYYETNTRRSGQVLAVRRRYIPDLRPDCDGAVVSEEIQISDEAKHCAEKEVSGWTAVTLQYKPRLAEVNLGKHIQLLLNTRDAERDFVERELNNFRERERIMCAELASLRREIELLKCDQAPTIQATKEALERAAMSAEKGK